MIYLRLAISITNAVMISIICVHADWTSWLSRNKHFVLCSWQKDAAAIGVSVHFSNNARIPVHHSIFSAGLGFKPLAALDFYDLVSK